MRTTSLGGLTPTRAFSSIQGLPLPMLFTRRKGPGGEYTIACAEPFSTVTAGESGVTVAGAPAGPSGKDPLDALGTILKTLGKEYGPFEAGPYPFNGGAAGYFAYDLKDTLTGCGGGRADGRGGGLGLPVMLTGIYSCVYVFDHARGEAFLVERAIGGPRAGAGFKEALFKAAEAWALTPEPPAPDRAIPGPAAFTSNTTRDAHMAGIRKALDYIAAGDIYQINLSHLLTIPCPADPFGLYGRITGKSPASYGAYIDAGRFKVISNSPERLLRVSGGVIETSPIKGTRPRGKTPEEDARLVEELRASRKERAEHVMIVDLERNDLGRVAVPGSVEVAEFERIETLSGLHHMVSTVRGRLEPGTDPLTCLRAAFPGGSVTGAPKIRAMEIIEEIEKAPRGIYTGGIGWVDFSGEMDLAMAIRTAVHRDGQLYLSVGGGIVADSDPEAEYDETILKAKDFLELAAEVVPGTEHTNDREIRIP